MHVTHSYNDTDVVHSYESFPASRDVESQARRDIPLGSSIITRPVVLCPLDAPGSKERVMAEQTKTNEDLVVVVVGYIESLGEPLRIVCGRT